MVKAKRDFGVLNIIIVALVFLGLGIIGGVYYFSDDVKLSGEVKMSPLTPSEFGHNTDEIEGLREYVSGIVDAAIGDPDEDPCLNPTQIYTSVDLTNVTFNVAYKPAPHGATLPTSCFQSEGCNIIQNIYGSKGHNKTRVYRFKEVEETGAWSSSYVPKGGYINGDATNTNIVPSYSEGKIAIKDDNAYPEMDYKIIAIFDNSGSYGQVVYIC
ncbi:MAG: hypothetical protein AABX11_00095 [Nanoarchaeota archaeon]